MRHFQYILISLSSSVCDLCVHQQLLDCALTIPNPSFLFPHREQSLPASPSSHPREPPLSPATRAAAVQAAGEEDDTAVNIGVYSFLLKNGVYSFNIFNFKY